MKTFIISLVFLAIVHPVYGDEFVISSMDTLQFTPPKEKGRVSAVSGVAGNAVQFTFDEGSRGAFAIGRLRGTPEWDQAAGFSFMVKGDGSRSYGGLQFIYDEDYAVRYDFMFPLDSTEWRKITVAWSDLVPVLPGAKSRPLDVQGENRPSKLSSLWFGKWWYWGEYPAHSFAVDEIRLEKSIDREALPRPTERPLSRVAQKLKTGRPITIVTMGDSLTDFRHWANRQTAWPNLLRDRLKKEYGSTVTIINPAIGGTQLRQNLVLMPRWLAQSAEPDLVTVCFGGNDWEAGMRGSQFREANVDAVERIRRATNGKSDVLLMSTMPAVSRWTTATELAGACREAAAESRAGFVDTERVFLAAGEQDKERLFVRDMVHLSSAGHVLVADAIYESLRVEIGEPNTSRVDGKP